MPQPTTSDADSSVFLASFMIAQVDTRIVSVTRSTSCPSSTEATALISHTATHRARHQHTLIGAFSSTLHEQEFHAMQPAFPGKPRHQRKFLMPSAPSNRHLSQYAERTTRTSFALLGCWWNAVLRFSVAGGTLSSVSHSCRVEKLRFRCQTQHIHQTRSVTHDQLLHTSLVMISRQSFQLSESKQLWWSRLGTLLASVGAGR